LKNPFSADKEPVLKDKDCLESLENFVDTLGDWKEPLAHVTSGYEFK